MATSVVPNSVSELVERFDRNRAGYGPFFTALGWDVENRKGGSLPYREVIFEPSLKVGDETKAPDYLVRTGLKSTFGTV
jgi:hypothetical protein